MDYSKMTSQEFKDAYVLRREQIINKTTGIGSIRALKIYSEEYEKLCEDAVSGDLVAQDLMSQWYRNGNPAVEQNMEVSYKWLFLAGAGGNKFSIDRLKVHLEYAYEKIISSKDFEAISQKYRIDASNYAYILGQQICKAVVEDLKIDAYELTKQKANRMEFSSIVMRGFDRAIDRACEVAINELKK